MANKLLPASQGKNASVWCKTRRQKVESRDPEARRVAESFGNSGRTQTRMIIECSNGDVQVLRTVKNGVATAGPPSVVSGSASLMGVRHKLMAGRPP